MLNEKLEVQQINGAAQQLLHIRSAQDVLGDQVVRILDPKPFLDVLRFGRNLYNQRAFLAEYNLYADQTVLHDKDYHILILILMGCDAGGKRTCAKRGIEPANRGRCG